MELLKSPPTSGECETHATKPLDYYCLKCHVVICADCFIFGEHQEHKLSKKTELKDLNNYLISKLDDYFRESPDFAELKLSDQVETFLAEKIENKLKKSQQRVDSQLEVKKPN